MVWDVIPPHLLLHPSSTWLTGRGETYAACDLCMNPKISPGEQRFRSNVDSFHIWPLWTQAIQGTNIVPATDKLISRLIDVDNFFSRISSGLIRYVIYNIPQVFYQTTILSMPAHLRTLVPKYALKLSNPVVMKNFHFLSPLFKIKAKKSSSFQKKEWLWI